MPFLKKLLYYGLLAALTLLALEGMARAAYFLAFAEWYNGSLPAVAAANSTPPPPQPELKRRVLRPEG